MGITAPANQSSSFILRDDPVSAGVTSSQQDLMLYIDHLSNLCLEREPQEF